MGEITNRAKRLEVVIGVPSYDDWRAPTAVCVANMVSRFHETPFDGEKRVEVVNTSGSLLPENRHHVVHMALERDATHLLFVDADMQVPDDTLVRLLSHNKPMVGANYVRRHAPFLPTAHRGNSPVYTKEDSAGLEPVDHLGFGCVLIRMDVFDFVEPPLFRHTDRLDGKPGFVGEDVFFCRKVREAGIEIFIDQDVSKSTLHFTQMPLANQLHWDEGDKA